MIFTRNSHQLFLSLEEYLRVLINPLSILPQLTENLQQACFLTRLRQMTTELLSSCLLYKYIAVAIVVGSLLFEVLIFFLLFVN